MILESIFPDVRGTRKTDEIALSEESVLTSFSPEEVMPFTWSLLPYRNPLIQKSIWRLKYHSDQYTARILCAGLHSFIIEEMADLNLFYNFSNPIIIPMPISAGRRVERGYNQCELLVSFFHDNQLDCHFEICANILKKTRETGDQKRLSRKERQQNLHDCFSVAEPEKINGRNIILIDDVLTTGATLAEAKAGLEKAGARMTVCVTLAH